LPASNYLAFYDSSFNKLQTCREENMRTFGGSYDVNNGGFVLAMQASYGGVSTANMAYIRISGAAPGSQYIVTVNEEIEG
ncbi:MAG: hypothetical protein J6A62_02340, partial [Oscillospiraceae bacterium]|nr:hypothetical protein [Oscillospiraceae bacterium]